MIVTTMVSPVDSLSSAQAPTAQAAQHNAAELRMKAVAQEFEAVVLAEFLRAAGTEGIVQSFGGGIGEDQFASMLTDAQAEHMAARGGLGIAEMVLRAMMAKPASTEGAQ